MTLSPKWPRNKRPLNQHKNKSKKFFYGVLLNSKKEKIFTVYVCISNLDARKTSIKTKHEKAAKSEAKREGPAEARS